MYRVAYETNSSQDAMFCFSFSENGEINCKKVHHIRVNSSSVHAQVHISAAQGEEISLRLHEVISSFDQNENNLRFDCFRYGRQAKKQKYVVKTKAVSVGEGKHN